jgi:glutamine phosphoribosylpyrophosphate amidotransferase
MCAIFGSTSKEEFLKLAAMNAYRGGHSYSIGAYDTSTKSFKQLIRNIGEFDMIDESYDNVLWVGHQQAPTTDARDIDSVHPAVYNNDMLWHNGIIKDYMVKEWQQKYNEAIVWDTRWMARILNEDGVNGLSDVDGAFACLWYHHNELNLFRNDNSPMFINEETGSFSSTKFEKSVAIKSNVMYNYINGNWIKSDNTFNTKNSFFWSV